MLGYIWLFFIVTAVVVGGFTGRINEVGQAAIDYAGIAVEISISLIGIMCLWLGLMKLAGASGLIVLISRAIKPITRKLFPDVPPEHPAIGNIAMNVSANALGVTNAATPIGIKAMKEMQSLNKYKSVATNAMCTFLAINTAGVQLVPASIIGVLIGAGAENPTVIIGPTIFATGIALITAIITAKILEKLPVFRTEKYIEEGEK